MDQSRFPRRGHVQETQPGAGWLGELSLEFAARSGKSVLTRRRHLGPFLVQRAFYPEGPEVAHVYLLHPPGGVVGGDALHLDARVQQGARVLLTTPGATKLYRSPDRPSTQSQRLFVESGASLEWFPQETILFSGTESQTELTIELDAPEGAGSADFMGWELTCVGRPGSGERFERGHFVSRLSLNVAGRPLLLERLDLRGGSPFLEAPWGLRSAPVLGTFIATTQGATRAQASHLIDACRALTERDFPDVENEWRGLSALGAPGERQSELGCIIARYLGPSIERAKAWMIALWQLLRPALLGRPASVPRIWAT